MNHKIIDQRSLAMARIIARRLRHNPALLHVAHETLDRWLANCSPNNRSTLLEWKAVLDSGLEEALGLLCGADERSTRLRQSSPFAGEEFIARAERTDLILQFAQRRPS